MRAELVGDPLEHREVVVIHAAHQSRVDAILEPRHIERSAHRVEVRERLGAEEIEQLRCALDDRLHRRIFGVENAQRVADETAPRVFVEQRGMLLEVIDQRSAVRAPLVALTEAVELESHIAAFDQSELAPQRADHQDLLGIDVRPGIAERLDVELMELPIAALLLLFVAEHRAHRPQPQRPVVQRVVLDHRAHDAGSGLGTQGQLVAVHRVAPGVHLLLDDVGHLAQAAHEQRAVALHHRAHARLEPLPQRGVGQPLGARHRGRQDVVHAFDGTQGFSHFLCQLFAFAPSTFGRGPGVRVQTWPSDDFYPKRFSM